VPIADDSWPIVRRNGVEVAQRDPAMLVVQPTRAIRDVAATLARYGEHVEKDDWLILGSLIPPFPVHAGDTIDAEFGPLGRLSLTLRKRPLGCARAAGCRGRPRGAYAARYPTYGQGSERLRAASKPRGRPWQPAARARSERSFD
jgi:hypothetical protein